MLKLTPGPRALILTACVSAVCLISIPANARAQGVARVEALSIKLAANPNSPGRSSVTAQRFYYPHITLASLIIAVFDLQPYELSTQSLPNWVREDSYEVQATTAAPVSHDEMMRLMRTALTERFQLKFHAETQPRDVYALSVTGKGPKFATLAADAAPRTPAGPQMILSNVKGLVQFLNSMASIGALDRPVVDRTGLAGDYDIRLTLGTGDNGAGTVSSDEMFAISGTLAEQLGLELKPTRADLPLTILDAVSRPSGN